VLRTCAPGKREDLISPQLQKGREAWLASSTCAHLAWQVWWLSVCRGSCKRLLPDDGHVDEPHDGASRARARSALGRHDGILAQLGTWTPSVTVLWVCSSQICLQAPRVRKTHPHVRTIKAHLPAVANPFSADGGARSHGGAGKGGICKHYRRDGLPQRFCQETRRQRKRQ
jgi:hypothetical protein